MSLCFCPDGGKWAYRFGRYYTVAVGRTAKGGARTKRVWAPTILYCKICKKTYERTDE